MKIKTTILIILLFFETVPLIGCTKTILEPTVTPYCTKLVISTLEPLEAQIREIESSPTPVFVLITETTKQFQTEVSPIDGMAMVYVPAGEFLMGSTEGYGEEDEHSQHKVYLDAFWIDQTEVTNLMYAKCVNEGACTPPESTKSYSQDKYFGNPIYDNYPVIFVNWNQARKYCQWAQRILPTEAQWEKAARGIEALTYPWGNENPNHELANFSDIIGDTTNVGRFPAGASQYGALDLAGNVSEWVLDFYGAYPFSSYLVSNPLGPSTGNYRILRGGSWIIGPFLIRSSERFWVSPLYADNDSGFRCVLPEN